MKKILSVLLALAMVLSLSLTVISCNNSNEDAKESSKISESTTKAPEVTTENDKKVSFTFKVVDKDGKETTFELKSDREFLGQALLDEKLIEGEDSQYGLFVKVVNGIKADDSKQEWWALTKNSEMCMTGVDTTPIEKGATYAFTLTVGY